MMLLRVGRYVASAAKKDKEAGRPPNPDARAHFAAKLKEKRAVPLFRMGFPALRPVKGSSKETQSMIKYPPPNSKMSPDARRFQVGLWTDSFSAAFSDKITPLKFPTTSSPRGYIQCISLLLYNIFFLCL